MLFADLQGFTTFSENHDPAEVTAMLNTYFQVVVPPSYGVTAATSTGSSATR